MSSITKKHYSCLSVYAKEISPPGLTCTAFCLQTLSKINIDQYTPIKMFAEISILYKSKNILQHFPLKGTYMQSWLSSHMHFSRKLCKSFGTIFEKTFLFAVKYAPREKLPAKGHSLGHSFFSFPPWQTSFWYCGFFMCFYIR